jgi:hypothetical protein
MDFIEHIRVSQERLETEFRAEIDRPAAIFDTREIGGIGILEFSPAEGNKTRMFLLLVHVNVSTRECPLHSRGNFGDEDLERIDRQCIRRFGSLQTFRAGK